MTNLPTDNQLRLGGHAVTYQLGQATDAFVHLGTAPGWTPQPVLNALVESELIHLRSLAGFLLWHTGKVTCQSDDVRPSWYRNGDRWKPDGTDALKQLHTAISKTAAHAVVPAGDPDLPGHWPLAEALLVVAHALYTFHDDECTDLRYFTAGRWSLGEGLDQIDQLGLGPYEPDGNSNQLVSNLRAVLRAQLGWPTQ